MVENWLGAWWIECCIGEIAVDINKHMLKSAVGTSLVVTSRQAFGMLGGESSIRLQIHYPFWRRRAFEYDSASDVACV